MPPTVPDFHEAGGGDSESDDSDAGQAEFEDSSTRRTSRGRWSGSRWRSRLAKTFEDASAYFWLLDDQREIAYVSDALSLHLHQIAVARGFVGDLESLLDGLIGRPAVATSESEPSDILAELAAKLSPPPGTSGAFALTEQPWSAGAILVDESSRSKSAGDCRVCFIPLAADPADKRSGAREPEPTPMFAIVLGAVNETVEEQFDRADLQSLWKQLGVLTRGYTDASSMVTVGQTSSSRRLTNQLDRITSQPGDVLLSGPRGFGAMSIMRWLRTRWLSTFSLHQNGMPPPCVHLDGPLMDVELLEALSAPAVNPLQSGSVPWAVLLVTEIDRMPLDAQMRLHSIQQSIDEATQDRSMRLHIVASIHKSADSNKGTSSFANANPSNDYLLEAGSIDVAENEKGNTLCDPLADKLLSNLVEVPSISKRIEDLPMIVMAIMQQLRRDLSLDAERFSRDALDALLAYPWPGQFDELFDVVRSASQAAGSSASVQREHLPLAVRTFRGSPESGRHEIELIGTLDEALERFEGYWIDEMMRRADGNRAEAARLLGISRSRLIRKLDGA